MATLLDSSRSYVAGQWVQGDAAFAVENPADESTVAEVSATPLAEIERAVVEARRSFDRGVWADLAPTERAARVGALLDHLETMKDDLVHTMILEAGQPRGLRRGLAVRHGHGSGTVHDRPVPVHAPRGAQPGPRRRARGGTGGAQRPSVRAGGCRRGDHALQRGDHHGLPEGRARAARRQLRGPPAEPAHAHLVARLRSRRRRGRDPARRAERDRRGRGRRRRAAHDPSRRGCGVVHRLDLGRTADPRPGRPDGEAGHAGARRQVGADLLRRRASPGARSGRWSRSP